MAATINGTAQSGLRDRSGNALYRTGFEPDGHNYTRDFRVTTGTQVAPVQLVDDGRTYPQTPGAVASDADGDHVVAWSAIDATGTETAFTWPFTAMAPSPQPC